MEGNPVEVETGEKLEKLQELRNLGIEPLQRAFWKDPYSP